MDGLDKAGREEEAAAGSHRARQNVRPPMAPTGRAHQRVNSAVGLRLDTLGTLSILSGGSGSTGDFSGEQRRDVPESGSSVTGHGDHDRILESDEGNEDSSRETPEDAVRTTCEQAVRNILGAEMRRSLQAVLRKELRGGLQVALLEEVGRAVREEFQSCSQELRELRPQRTLVESGCQADATAAPVQLRPRHAKNDGDRPTRASFPQPKTSSWHAQLVTPDPWARTVATASRGQKPSLPGPGDEASQLILPRHGVEAHHRTGCGDSFESGASNSGQSMVEPVEAARRSLVFETRELLWQNGLLEYSALDQARPARWQGSGFGTGWSASSPQVASRACQTDADQGGGADARHPACLSKEDFSELGSLEQLLAGEFLCEDVAKGLSSKSESSSAGNVRGPSSPTKVHAWPEDGILPRGRAGQRAPSPGGGEGCWSLGSEEASVRSLEEAARQEASASHSKSLAEEAAPAEPGSVGRSASGRGGPGRLEAGLWAPTAEPFRMQMDKDVVSQCSLDNGDGELESVASAHPRAKAGRCSWLAALPAKIGGLLGSRVAPACGIIPWDQAYPLASTLYQWIMFGFVGTSLYHTGSRTYEEWEQGESREAVLLALDAILGTGALAGIVSCGALWGSTGLLNSGKLVMVYAGQRGQLAHWEEVCATDFLRTLMFWLAAVLTAAAEALYFEQPATAGELLSHVGCFALFAFILLGMSQLAIHMCRCVATMVDTFCHRLYQQPDFPKAIEEWSLLQALCRSVSTSIQLAFVSLQATAAAVVMLSIQAVGRHAASHLRALVPGLIVAMGVFRTSLWAATVTAKCARVPMLVNAVQVDYRLNQERMYAVHYIAYSQAGFYVFDLRLTSATVLKTAYVACAVTFFLATKVFVE